MAIFISIIISVLFILLTIYLGLQLMKLSQNIKAQTKQINELDAQLYSNLRMVQYKAMDITKQANKFINSKNSLLAELVSTVAIAVLPFKKLKSLIYLHKLGKKVIR